MRRPSLLWVVLFAGGSTLTLVGCKSGASPAQACHSGDDGLELVTVSSEAELQAHLDHGDAFGIGLDSDCGGGVSFRIDVSAERSTTELPGFRGGEPRPVGVLTDEQGLRDEYVENEVEVQFESDDELERFLTLYDGAVLRDDTALIVNEDGELESIPGGLDGWYLVKIGRSASRLLDLPRLAADLALAGSFSVSSEAALRTLALHFREQGTGASANFVVQPDALYEHPLSDPALPPTSYLDMSTQWWMTDDEDPLTPGDQGLSIGLARAFDYLRHIGHPPQNGVWTPAKVAIIDVGFDLDEETGLGNADYNNRNDTPPSQIDLIDDDETAGGAGPDRAPWHGQGTFGVCCAYPRNRFGGAGTGGEYVRPILIKSGFSAASVAEAVRTAALMGASVINMSFGWYCTNMCQNAANGRLQQEIRNAVDGMEIAVFASAGNGINNDGTGDANIDGLRKMPCDFGGVTCVGAVDVDGNNVWNWGDAVDIWAPTNTRATVSPNSADLDGNDWGLDEVSVFNGTSAASPFAAGIAGLIKSVAPEYPGYLIEQVLKDTANQSADPLVLTGYVDALRAIQEVRPNPPPRVDISAPSDGSSISWYSQRVMRANVSDPSAPLGFDGTVTFASDVQGEVCSVTRNGSSLSCEASLQLGKHVITATATDQFGASATSAPVSFDVVNAQPRVNLFSPNDGAILFADQLIPLRANIVDGDSEPFDTSCAALPTGPCVEWTSSLEGVVDPLVPGAPPWSNATRLSVGAHSLTVTVRDGRGATASHSVQVTVQAGQGRPSAVILTPNNPMITELGWKLEGRGSDAEDGALAGNNLQWFSDRDGFLGTGELLYVDLSGPPNPGGAVGHTITLVATDSDANEGTDQILISVYWTP